MFFNLIKKTDSRDNDFPDQDSTGIQIRSGAKLTDSCFDRLHRKEKDEFLALIANTCDQLPANGEKVLDYFICMEGHITPEYLARELAEQGKNISVATITEVLELLCRYGIAQKVMLNGTGPWYEHLHLGNRHDHLVCTKCGKIVEFEDESLNRYIDRVAGEQQFLPLAHKLNIVGICPACQKGEEHLMPLALASHGERVKIIKFDGGPKMKERLTSMGLSIGETIEVLNNAGPFIVNARNSRLALGKGLAQKVIVSLVRGDV